jgi:hypothetical protein
VRLIGSGVDINLGVDRGTLFVHATSDSEQRLTWMTPKQTIDASLPLARLVIGGDRAQMPPVDMITGTLAVLRMQALTPGSTSIYIDKLSLKDKYGQELQVRKETPITIKITP